MIQVCYGLTIFISAALIFLIQPMVAKALLPVFGGSAFVWIACVLFFQVSLLLGYCYAYALSRFVNHRWQCLVHGLGLLATCWFLPITLKASQSDSFPPFHVVYLLSTSCLLPMVLVCSTSPLLQQWFAKAKPQQSPYFFYAISNAGSLLGLILYPFSFELFLDLPTQFTLWSVVFALFILSCLFASKWIWQLNDKTALSGEQNSPLQTENLLSWIALAFLGSCLLLASTLYVSQNLINMPLVWLIPLALYLISFMLTFSEIKQIDFLFWCNLYVVWGFLFTWLIFKNQLSQLDLIIVLFALSFSGMMVCHRKLYALRPSSQHLSLYYLMIALGGALGGLFVNGFSLLDITQWWDLFLPILIVASLCAFCLIQNYRQQPSISAMSGSLFSVILIPTFLITLGFHFSHSQHNMVKQLRSAYGVITVKDRDKNSYAATRVLQHGTIIHGFQYLNQNLMLQPTAYYGAYTGLAGAVDFLHQETGPIKVAAIGLGTGTLSALAKAQDSIDFFEIDEHMIDIAYRYFEFIRRSPARVQVHLGDGRLEMQKLLSHHTSPQYDLIVVDAFSGDSIPFHLMTEECYTLYNRLLKPNGILAFHITNSFVDLAPVTQGLAQKNWLQHIRVMNPTDAQTGVFLADWVLLSKHTSLDSWLKHHDYLVQDNQPLSTILWTDKRNSLLPILRLTTDENA